MPANPECQTFESATEHRSAPFRTGLRRCHRCLRHCDHAAPARAHPHRGGVPGPLAHGVGGAPAGGGAPPGAAQHSGGPRDCAGGHLRRLHSGAARAACQVSKGVGFSKRRNRAVRLLDFNSSRVELLITEKLGSASREAGDLKRSTFLGLISLCVSWH
jgi:hypothetical protein